MGVLTDGTGYVTKNMIWVCLGMPKGRAIPFYPFKLPYMGYWYLLVWTKQHGDKRQALGGDTNPQTCGIHRLLWKIMMLNPQTWPKHGVWPQNPWFLWSFETQRLPSCTVQNDGGNWQNTRRNLTEMSARFQGSQFLNSFIKIWEIIWRRYLDVSENGECLPPDK